MQRHQPFQVVGQFGTVLRLPLAEGIALRIVGVTDVVDATEHLAEHAAVGDDAAYRDAAEVDAVVAALPADQAGSGAFAARPVIGDRHLERGLHRLGPGVGEEHLVEPGWRELRQLARQFESQRMRHVEGRRIVEFGCLALNGLNDLGPVVAGIDAPQAGHAVQHLATFRRLEIHAVGACEQARRLLELAVGGERHPEGRQLFRRQSRVGFR